MDKPVRLTDALNAFRPAEDAMFASGERVLMTRGVFERITTPAIDANGSSDSLRRDIMGAFASARAAGISSPIIIGSIPFDATKPSALVIPTEHQWCLVSDLSVAASQSIADTELTPTELPVDLAGQKQFEKAVHDLLPLFEQTALRKVVLSRALDVDFATPIETARVITELLSCKDSAFRFSIPVDQTNALVGRSPELLIRRTGSKIHSNPLAGTVPRSAYKNLEDAASYLLSSEKDRLEHDMVAAEVRDVMQGFCSDALPLTEPSVLTTEALFHLSTEVTGVLANRATTALEIACALHPTPAVCGLPRVAAREQIAEKESFDRGYFTGTTGWMDASGDGEWAVTIRCGLLSEKRMRLFAGAGIVKGSKPEREWEETSAKLMPMLRTIANSQRALS